MLFFCKMHKSGSGDDGVCSPAAPAAEMQFLAIDSVDYPFPLHNGQVAVNTGFWRGHKQGRAETEMKFMLGFS